VTDPFADALTSLDDLVARYPAAKDRAWTKDIGSLDEAARALIAERQALITDLDRARDDYLASTRGSSF